MFARSGTTWTQQAYLKASNTEQSPTQSVGSATGSDTGIAEVRGRASSRDYVLDFEFKFFDRYNWDNGKKVEIFGVTITDYFMGEFHRQGLAQEFDCHGSIRRRFAWKHGAAIPKVQLDAPSEQRS